MHRIAAVTALLMASSAPSARADANSLFDSLGPREIAVGESLRAEAKGGMATTLNPAGLPLTHELVLETNFGYRPSDGANIASISACDSTVPVPGCFYYRYFSADPEIAGIDHSRRAHEVGYVAARAVGKFVLGFTYKYFDYNSDLDGEGDESGHSTDFGITLVPSSTLKLAFVGYNVLSTADSPQYPRAYATGLVLRPSQSLSLSADALWNADLEEGQSTGRYGGGAEFFVMSGDQQSGYPLRAGVVYDNTVDGTYATAGAGYRTIKVGLDIGMRKQVSGGDELLIIGSIRLFAPPR